MEEYGARMIPASSEDMMDWIGVPLAAAKVNVSQDIGDASSADSADVAAGRGAHVPRMNPTPPLSATTRLHSSERVFLSQQGQLSGPGETQPQTNHDRLSVQGKSAILYQQALASHHIGQDQFFTAPMT
ncbi:unnamed protein product, partial [Choristocarpus tenellus]